MNYITYIFLIYIGFSNTYSIEKSVDNKWDVLIFTLQWPSSKCLQLKEQDPKRTCSLPSEPIWTIHGIWPTKLETMVPKFCNKSLDFNETAILPIEEDLQLYWHDIEYNENISKHKFWEQQWKKHGTCAVLLPALNSQIKYFSQGLEWIKAYPMEKILSESGILPNNNYTPQAVWEAVQKKLGKNPAIICGTNKTTQESYLFEMRICFDKMLYLTDCDGIEVGKSEYSTGIITNCPNHSITYPAVLSPENDSVLGSTTENDSGLASTTFNKHYWIMKILFFIPFLKWISF